MSRQRYVINAKDVLETISEGLCKSTAEHYSNYMFVPQFISYRKTNLILQPLDWYRNSAFSVDRCFEYSVSCCHVIRFDF